MKSAVFLGLLLFGLGFLPLLGGPRYEAALLAGLLAPSFVVQSASRSAFRAASELKRAARADGLSRVLPGTQLLELALLKGGLHGLVVMAVALIHGLIGGMCEPELGFGLLALGPVLGVVLASVLGTLAGVSSYLLFERSKLGRGPVVFTAVVALFIPLGSFVLGVFAFYTTPAVYGYDPFVGYFSGPLYDTVEYDLLRLLSYRVGTLFTILGVFAALSQVVFKIAPQGTSLLKSGGDAQARAFLAFSLTFALGSAGMALQGEELGHRTTASSLSEGLGRMTSRGPCQVHFSEGVARPEATQIAAECLGHLSQLSEYFDVPVIDTVDVYVFSSAGEKRRYIGAATTYIAKPWRREIYLQPGNFPHPVLGHELAHVVAADFGTGPLKVAGHLAGFLPDPGRIEGFAEAASPHEHADGTLHQWAAAMKQLELLPPASRLFQLSFLSGSAAKAYGAAGSFVDFVRQKSGPAALRAWYGGASLSEATGTDLSGLEDEWHHYLDTIEVSPAVLSISEPRFRRPGVFERRCPHAVDRLLGEAGRLCGVQQNRVQEAVTEAVRLDPLRKDAEVQVPRCAWYAGAEGEALSKTVAAQAEAEEVYSPGARQNALDLLGDMHWANNRPKDAKEAYEAALSLTHSRDSRREMEVKIWALSATPEIAEPVRLLLASDKQGEWDPALGVARWAALGKEREMASYLLFRRAFFSHRLAEARMYENLVDEAKLPLLSVRMESARTSLLLACRLVTRGGDAKALENRAAAYRKYPLDSAQKYEVDRLMDRCLAASKSKEGAPK